MEGSNEAGSEEAKAAPKKGAGGVNSRQAILEGPIVQTWLQVAWPMVSGTLLARFEILIATFWIGQLLGTDGMSVIALATPVAVVFNLVLHAAPSGVQTLVARSVGKGDGEAARVIISGSYFSLVLAAVLAISSLLLLSPILGLLGDQLEAADLRSYLVPFLLLLPLATILNLATIGVAGTGWTRFGLVRTIVSIAIGAVLLPIFIDILDLGIAGVALAEGAADLFLLALTAYALYKYREKLGIGKVDKTAFRFSGRHLKRILSIGVPPALARAIEPGVQIAFISILATSGKSSVAGYHIGAQVLLVASSVTMAMAQAGAIMISQSAGAGDPQRARTCVRKIMTVMLLGSLALNLVGFTGLLEPIVSLFSDDESAIPDATRIAQVLLLLLPVYVVGQVLAVSYFAVGNTRLLSLVLAIGSLLSLAVAYLSPGTGVERVIAGLVTAAVIRGVLLIVIYPRTFRPEALAD